MHKYAVTLSYAGTRFCGWQKQRGSAAMGAPSIQETVQKGLEKITGEDVSIVGSGRTDAGVHALAQVAHFTLAKKEWSTSVLQKGLNWVLRPDIQVSHVRRVSFEFHAQRSAIKKQYSYYFQQGPCALPHVEPYSWWITRKLDQKAMQKALDHLVGEHDFKAFQARGTNLSSTTRRIIEAEIHHEKVAFPGLADDFSFVRMRVLGTGFLKQMVRGIAGTLLQVGEGRRPPSCMHEILESQDRSLLGMTAPGRALWLERVWYPPELYGAELYRVEL